VVVLVLMPVFSSDMVVFFSIDCSVGYFSGMNRYCSLYGILVFVEFSELKEQCWYGYYTVKNSYSLLRTDMGISESDLGKRKYNLVQGSSAGMLSCIGTGMMLVLVQGSSVGMLSCAGIKWYYMLMGR
jgi:hypothetical protein